MGLYILLICNSLLILFTDDNYKDADGKYRQLWCSTNIRISDLALSPDLSKLVAIGMLHKPVPTVAPSNAAQENGTPPTSAAQPLNSRQIDYFMLVYDFSSKAQLS